MKVMRSTHFKHASLALLALTAVVLAQTSQADDAMTRATPTTKELMRDCIRKHQASDVNLSKSELNRICKDEVKREKANGTPPPADSPQQ